MNDTGSNLPRGNFFRKASSHLLWALVDVSVILAGVIALFGFAARLSWAADMCCQFRVQIMMFLLPATLFYWLLRRGPVAWWLLACLVANVIPMAPYFWPVATQVTKDDEFTRIILLNVLVDNPHHSDVVEYVQEKSPDIFIALEADQNWTNGLEPLRASYPHRYLIDDLGTSSFAAYSRIPFDSIETLESTTRRLPSIDLTVTLGGKQLQVVATHPYVPRTEEKADLRNEQMQDVAEAMDRTKSRMLIGDFNCTPWSPHFTDMLAIANVTPAGYGYGLTPTWYHESRRLGSLNGTWVFGLMLDHILIGPSVSVRHYGIGPPLGSDHRPVIVDFQLVD